jgi:hypothetical protein
LQGILFFKNGKPLIYTVYGLQFFVKRLFPDLAEFPITDKLKLAFSRGCYSHRKEFTPDAYILHVSSWN